MKIFLTNLPSFYKVNLYNELAKKMPILVVFSGIGGNDRNKDFFHGDINFKHITLSGNVIKKIWNLFLILRCHVYEEFVIGGWENIVALAAPFLSSKRLNACIIESSAFESSRGGYKYRIKRIFVRRISKVYASGVSQARLARSLGFVDGIKLTGGCGLLNYVDQPYYQKRDVVKNFLYVGRLAEEKNLLLLIEVFNELPNLQLAIAGFGVQEQELKLIAKNNVTFLGAINNKELPNYYRQADVFILPSKSEPWGLVVEEALNNGTPVIVSDMVGCRESIVTERLGIVFKHDNKEDLFKAINKMTDIESYNKMREAVANLNFKDRAEKQVKVYL